MDGTISTRKLGVFHVRGDGTILPPVAGAETQPAQQGGQQEQGGSTGEAQGGTSTQTQGTQQQSGGESGGQGEAKPPWGDKPADFDPDKAWSLIQNVRADADKAKRERDELKSEKQKQEDAKKSDLQKAQDSASSAKTEAQQAKLEAARLRVALKKGLSETQAKRLVGDDEAALEKDADELLASFKQEGGEGGGGSRRPQERLRPGAAPSAEPDETDPSKLAARVPSMF